MTYKQLISIIILFSTIPAIFFAFFHGKIVAISILTCFPMFFALVFFIMRIPFPNMDAKNVVRIFILYSLILFIRGIIDAKSYQDWTTLLSSGFTLMMFLPLTIYLGTQPKYVTQIFRSFIYIIPLIFILFFKDNVSAGPLGFAKTISPIYLFVLMIPYTNRKLRILIIIISLISFFKDITVRANMINIIVAYTIIFSFRFRKSNWILNIIKNVRVILIVSPIVLLILGLTSVFNIFQIGEYLGSQIMLSSEDKSQDVLVDSRTSIYNDVIGQLVKDKSIIFGLGASGKTETSLTDATWGDFDIVYKEGRRSTESSMLNYAQYGGILGSILYFLLFIVASYYGINKSNNWFSIMLGIWVMYKGFFAFIEDPLDLSVSSVFILIPIGISLNRGFRQLNDKEIKYLFYYLMQPKKSDVIIQPRFFSKT